MPTAVLSTLKYLYRLFLDPETGPQALPTSFLLLCFFLVLLLSDFQCTKTLSFLNRTCLGRLSPIHTADADETKLSSLVASAV